MSTRHEHNEQDTSPGMHHHEHVHDSSPAHRHPHHHSESRAVAEHAHGATFESLTYICSPIHALDPRTKIISAISIIIAIVAGPPMQAQEFVATVLLLIAVGSIARLPLGKVLLRSALILPFAGTIALFAPLQGDAGSLNVTGFATAYSAGGWIAAWAILSKAWLSAFTMLLLAATTPPPLLFEGLSRLRMPRIMILLLSFIYRYFEVLRAQIRSMRRAISSRGFATSGWRLMRLYGHLAGNVFIRSYERGERVYAAMVARGYDGTMPASAEPIAMGPSDALALFSVGLSALALLLY